MAVKTGVNVTGLISGYIWTDTALTTQHEGYLVTLDTANGPNGVKLAGAGASVIGAIADQKIYAVGDPVSIAGFNNTKATVKAGSAGFAIGDYLKSDASALAITASATDEYFGEALSTATTGQMGEMRFKAGANNSSVNPWTRSATIVKPTTAGDSIASGTIASAAAILTILDNGITAGGTGATVNIVLAPKGTTGAIDIQATAPEIKTTTGTNTNIKITPNGLGVVDIGGSAPEIKTSIGTNTDIILHPNGSGTVKIKNSTYTTAEQLLPVYAFSLVPATTGSSGSAGRVACVGMTSAGSVLAVAAEDCGTNLVISDVVCGTDYFTVYSKDVTGIPGRAALSSKKVSYIVLGF